MPTIAATSGSRSARTIRVQHQAMTIVTATVTIPTAATASTPLVNGRDAVAASASSTTFSGEVAVFDTSCWISPQCRSRARLRA
jgi:hypothetical protein